MGTEVTRQADRYEITVDGEHAGFAFFELHAGVVVFTHTEVDDAFEGKGIGSQLAEAALDDVRARGLKVQPLCPFIKAWIEKHPDYRELVA